MMNIAYVGEENAVKLEEIIKLAESYQQYRRKSLFKFIIWTIIMYIYSYSTVFSHY